MVQDPWSIIMDLTPQDERQGNIKKFQDDPECRFLIRYTADWWLWYYSYCS
jgi:hypothetical protein